MPRITILALLVSLACGTPSLAALPVGANAPPFTAPAFLAGRPWTFSLAAALRKGPVVLYFFPAAHTSGCNLEAHLFAQAADAFRAQGASVIGVTAGNVDQLAAFSTETEHCSGKFPVAADPGARIAARYKATLAMRPGWSDRTSYVIAPTGKIIFVWSDLAADQHVAKSLAAVKAWRAAHPA